MTSALASILESGAFDQASLVLRRTQEKGHLLHVVVTHSLARRHLRIGERTEEAGSAQSQFQSGKMKANANCWAASVSVLRS